MPAKARIRRTESGRWEVRTRGGEAVTLPTRALAEDYAGAVDQEPAPRWSTRRREVIALALSTMAVVTAGAGWTMTLLMEHHPLMTPYATVAGSIALAMRVGFYLKG